MTDKPKFKQTEVGLIPSDWEETYLGNIGPVKMCKRVMKYQTSEKGDIPFYKIGTFGKSPDAYISKDLYHYLKNKYSFPQKGTVLISAAGTIGRTVVYDGKDAFFQDSNIVWLENDESVLTNQYLYYLYQVVEWKTENGGAVSRLYNDNFKITPIAIPSSKKEQQRIANALSDVDTLITNLEKLIAKKKNIKQGAMQQLLTGRVRLPGCRLDNGHTDWFTPNGVHDKSIKTAKVVRPESIRVKDKEQCTGYKMTELGLIPSDWEVKKLSSVCTIIMGQSPDSKYYNEKEGTPLIQGNADIENRETFVRFYTTQITKKGLKGDLILTVRAPVGSVAKATFDCCLGRGVCALRNANDFLYQYLIYIEKEWVKRSAGSTFDSIKSDELSATLVVVPSSKAEQTAIANVLSDMDTEISALETKLAKYRSLKTGMMQQLLTGKIRLV